jgi:hypothetical protein
VKRSYRRRMSDKVRLGASLGLEGRQFCLALGLQKPRLHLCFEGGFYKIIDNREQEFDQTVLGLSGNV